MSGVRRKKGRKWFSADQADKQDGEERETEGDVRAHERRRRQGCGREMERELTEKGGRRDDEASGRGRQTER